MATIKVIPYTYCNDIWHNKRKRFKWKRDSFRAHLPALHKIQLYDNNKRLLKYILIGKSRLFGNGYEMLIGFLCLLL